MENFCCLEAFHASTFLATANQCRHLSRDGGLEGKLMVGLGAKCHKAAGGWLTSFGQAPSIVVHFHLLGTSLVRHNPDLSPALSPSVTIRLFTISIGGTKPHLLNCLRETWSLWRAHREILFGEAMKAETLEEFFVAQKTRGKRRTSTFMNMWRSKPPAECLPVTTHSFHLFYLRVVAAA